MSTIRNQRECLGTTSDPGGEVVGGGSGSGSDPSPDPKDYCDPDDPTNAKVFAFVANNQAQADSVSRVTGLSSDAILAWAGYESSYGASNAATKDNNFYGLTPALGTTQVHWAGSDPYFTCVVSPYDCFMSQPQGLAASAISALSSFGGKYLAAGLTVQQSGGSVAAVAQAIADAGFNSEYGSGVYGSNVQSALDTINRRRDCSK